MPRYVAFFTVTVLLSSFAPAQDTVHVKEGWNIIGSVKAGAVPDVLATDPPGIIITSFFGYDPGVGYLSSDTLEKGFGYWVKVSEDGLILFEATPGDTVFLTDTVAVADTLYFADTVFVADTLVVADTLYISDTVFVADTLYVPDSLACGVMTVSYGGSTYRTEQIGSQCWLDRNLNIGEMIFYSTVDQSDNATLEKHCMAADPLNCYRYGGLYQWGEAMNYTTTPGAQGICPPGWHIPTNAEFQTLVSTVAGSAVALKAVGQGTAGAEGTDSSGFSGGLGGYLSEAGSYINLNNGGHFWSSTESSATNAHNMVLYSSSHSIFFYQPTKGDAYSIRCIRD